MKRLLAVFVSTLVILAVNVNAASAGILHILATSQLWYIEQGVAAFPGGELHRVDILFEGIPQPDQTIFGDIAIFPPFSSFDTDGDSFIHIFLDEPIEGPDAAAPFQVATFTSDLDWGEPGGPTPFTFVEYGAGGVQVEGTIHNAPPVGGTTELQVESALSLETAEADGPSSLPFAVVGGVAAGLVLLTAGGWYARRRWLG